MARTSWCAGYAEFRLGSGAVYLPSQQSIPAIYTWWSHVSISVAHLRVALFVLVFLLVPIRVRPTPSTIAHDADTRPPLSGTRLRISNKTERIFRRDTSHSLSHTSTPSFYRVRPATPCPCRFRKFFHLVYLISAGYARRK